MYLKIRNTQFRMENGTLLWLLEFSFTVSYKKKKAMKNSNRIFFLLFWTKASSSISAMLLSSMLFV